MKLNFELTELILKVLTGKINNFQFEHFLRSNSFKITGNKGLKLYNMQQKLNAMEKKDFKENWKKVEDFLYDQIMYTTTRTVVSFCYETIKSSSLISVQSLLSNSKVTEKDYNFQKSLKTNWRLGKDYNLVYRKLTKVSGQENKVEKIDFIYVRKVKYKNDDKGTLRAEFIWIEVDNLTEEIRIHFEKNNRTILEGQAQGTPLIIYNYFSLLLSRELLISVLPTNEKETLFDIYKELTSQAEKKYTDKVDEKDNKIGLFRKEMMKDLDLTDADDHINSLNRLKLVFTRLLIQKDYDEFIKEQSKNIGRIKAILFHDPEGGSVHANSSTATKGTDPNELDLEKHTVYFDTRDSIYTEEKLFSITVFWNMKIDEKIKIIKVKYTAFDNFFVTHFIRNEINKEMCEYVLSKFREFKK